MNVIFDMPGLRAFWVLKPFLDQSRLDGFSVMISTADPAIKSWAMRSGVRWVLLPSPTTRPKFGSKRLSYSWRQYQAWRSFHPDWIFGLMSNLPMVTGWLMNKPICFLSDNGSLNFLQKRLLRRSDRWIQSNSSACEISSARFASLLKGPLELMAFHPQRFVPDPGRVNQSWQRAAQDYVVLYSSRVIHLSFETGFRVHQLLEVIAHLRGAIRVIVMGDGMTDLSLKPYRVSVDPNDVAHVLGGARLVVSDDLSVARAAMVMGVASFYFQNGQKDSKKIQNSLTLHLLPTYQSLLGLKEGMMAWLQDQPRQERWQKEYQSFLVDHPDGFADMWAQWLQISKGMKRPYDFAAKSMSKWPMISTRSR